MIDAYGKLSRAKSLGFYNCCELTTVFLHCKKDRKNYHFFSIFVLEERAEFEAEEMFLTPSLLPIGNKFSMGIRRRVMTLAEAEECCHRLQTAIGGNMVNLGEGNLEIGFLEAVPPVFVQKDSTMEICSNKVLKNNFKNGSYLLEFFDTDKKVCQLLKKEELHRACEMVFQYVPVNLFTVSDRIGNFIFQFPSINSQISYCQNKEEDTLIYHIKMDARLDETDGYQLIAELYYDDTVTGFGTMEVHPPETEGKLCVGDTSTICRTTLIDSKNQLILSRQETRYMRKAQLRLHMGSTFGKERVIYDKDGGIRAYINVDSAETITPRLPDKQYRKKWMNNRRYRLRMEELENRKEFLRYGVQNGSGREKAIADLRELMQRGDGHNVYLWDPYLTARDLLDTWYYTTTYGMKLKAITSRADLDKKAVGEKTEMERWVREQAEMLQKGSNQYGIDLELRCQWKGYGYPFHDRFLMIVDETEKPQAWSLGASVNSIGKQHHIIQKVLHPQMIVDAFEELWDMLSAKECLVWKSK